MVTEQWMELILVHDLNIHRVIIINEQLDPPIRQRWWGQNSTAKPHDGERNNKNVNTKCSVILNGIKVELMDYIPTVGVGL